MQSPTAPKSRKLAEAAMCWDLVCLQLLHLSENFNFVLRKMSFGTSMSVSGIIFTYHYHLFLLSITFLSEVSVRAGVRARSTVGGRVFDTKTPKTQNRCSKGCFRAFQRPPTICHDSPHFGRACNNAPRVLT